MCAPGNSVYRASALYQVGLFDESLGYGYDNDMSYRLAAAGYRLVLCRRARSVHRWREGIRGYLVQQYRLRIRPSRRDRKASAEGLRGCRFSGSPDRARRRNDRRDRCWPVRRRCGARRGRLATSRRSLRSSSWPVLALDRGVAGVRAARRFHDPAAFLFVPAAPGSRSFLGNGYRGVDGQAPAAPAVQPDAQHASEKHAGCRQRSRVTTLELRDARLAELPSYLPSTKRPISRP